MFDALRRFVRPNVTQHAPAVKMPIMNIDRSHSCDVEYRQITLWRQSIERAVPHKIARLYGKTHVRPYSCQSCRETKDATHFFLFFARVV